MQDIEHRRPYESLLLCWPAHLPDPPGAPAAPAAGGDASGGSCFHVLREPLVVVAVPPASHSRKPHLGPLLLPLLPDGARCLEVRGGWPRKVQGSTACMQGPAVLPACTASMTVHAYACSNPVCCCHVLCRCLPGSCTAGGPAGAMKGSSFRASSASSGGGSSRSPAPATPLVWPLLAAHLPPWWLPGAVHPLLAL